MSGPRRPFVCADDFGTASGRAAWFASSEEIHMAHWRKPNPQAAQFKACLARYAILLSAVFGTLILFARHYA
jgi:hypothetical protein